MSSGGDEVEKGVHTVVLETRITLDTRLLSKDVVVLTFKICHNFLKARQ